MARTRAGRPRKNAPRGKSAKIVRKTEAQIIKEMRAIVIGARERVYGLSPASAAKEESGSYIGRLRLSGAISTRQLDAAVEYEKARRAYDATVGIRPVRSSSEFEGVGGYDGSDGSDPAYIARCQRARTRYIESRRALLQAHAFAHLAVESWVIDDVPVWNLIGELRLGLNELAHLYGVDEWRVAS